MLTYGKMQHDSVLSNFLQSNCEEAWPCHLELANFKWKYINEKPISEMLYIGNSNTCPIHHRLWLALPWPFVEGPFMYVIHYIHVRIINLCEESQSCNVHQQQQVLKYLPRRSSRTWPWLKLVAVYNLFTICYIYVILHQYSYVTVFLDCHSKRMICQWSHTSFTVVMYGLQCLIKR